MSSLPRRQRVAAYAVILREEQILLCRLAERISPEEMWTLPGGGLEHGEHPHDALVREIKEETGLDALVGETARVYSAHLPGVWREGSRVDAHALRLVFEGWVPTDAPPPRVLEVGGSTVEARWVPVADVLAGTVPVAGLVMEALAEHRPFQMQRLAVNALVRSADRVLLTRISAQGYHTGAWTLPGGGVDHGESPADALRREVREECGLDCAVGGLLGVHEEHFSGTAPSGRYEDFHNVRLVFSATVPEGAEPRAEADGTTDAAAWVPVADIESGRVPVHDLVPAALAYPVPR